MKYVYHYSAEIKVTNAKVDGIVILGAMITGFNLYSFLKGQILTDYLNKYPEYLGLRLDHNLVIITSLAFLHKIDD